MRSYSLFLVTPNKQCLPVFVVFEFIFSVIWWGRKEVIYTLYRRLCQNSGGGRIQLMSENTWLYAVLPLCEGHPDGPWPAKRNDQSVRGTQGDLILCPDCNEYRFPTSSKCSSKSKQSAAKTSSGNAGGCRDGKTTTAVEPAGAVPVAGTTHVLQVQLPQLVVCELLSYICHHRDNCSQAALIRVVGSLYTPTVSVNTAKSKCVVSVSCTNLKNSTLFVM